MIFSPPCSVNPAVRTSILCRLECLIMETVRNTLKSCVIIIIANICRALGYYQAFFKILYTLNIILLNSLNNAIHVLSQARRKHM